MNKPLRIAVVSASIYPYSHGGIARWMTDLVPELIRQGHDVRLLTKEVDPSDSRRYLVKVNENPATRYLPTAFPHIDLFSSGVVATLDEMATSGWKPDVVYGSAWDCEVLAPIRSGRYTVMSLLVTPLKVTIQHSGIIANDHDKPIFKEMQRLEAECITTSHSIHAISTSIVHTISREYELHIPSDKVRVIPLGMPDTEDEHAALHWNKHPHVLFVGRREERKGIDLFLHAIPQILQHHPKTRFTVAGQEMPSATRDQTFQAIFNSANGLFVRRRVTFISNIDDARLQHLYRTHEITCTPSRYESFGLVAVEAMRARSAPVVADGSGLAEVVNNGADGIVLASLTSHSITDAITSLLDDRELLTTIREHARDSFKRNYLASQAAAALSDYMREQQ